MKATSSRRQIVLMTLTFASVAFGSRSYFIRQPSNQTVVEGQSSVIMKCYVANFDGDVNWSRNGFSWNFADNHSPIFKRYSLAESDRQGEKNLMIRDVTIEDDGFYDCQVATRSVKLQSRKAFLTVQVPPKQLVLSPSVSDVISVMRGEHVNIRCQATDSKPESDITWRVENDDVMSMGGSVLPSTEGSKLVTTSSFINLYPTIAQNGSVVECIASHPATKTPVSTKAVLNVLYPPGAPVIEGNVDGPVISGSEVIVTCTSTGGNPLASLSWTIDDVTVPQDYHHVNGRSTSELRHVISAHNKMITCSATSPALPEPLTTSITLDVQFPPENIDISQHPSDGAFENSTVTLTCLTSESNPRATLSWLKNGNPVARSDVTESHSKLGSFSRAVLTLTDVQRSDTEDNYICRVAVPELSYQNQVSAQIKVLYPPYSVDVDIYYLGLPLTSPASSSATSQVLRGGQTIQIKCVATGGNPAPNLKWYRDGRLITAADSVAILTGTSVPSCIGADETCSILEMTLTSAENGARFECAADHVASSVAKRSGVTLQVLFAPTSLSIEQFPLAPVSGQPMSLTCITSSSNPESQITWLRGGAALPSESATKLESRPGEDGGVISASRLQLSPTSQDHGKTITCRAKNPILEESVNRDVVLNVEFAPQFESDTLRINTTEGDEELVVFVPVEANPRNVTFRWWRLEEDPDDPTRPDDSGRRWRKVLLTSDERVSWSVGEGILRIRDVRKSDAGVYLAEVNNPRGTAEINVTLDVLYAPRIVALQGPSDVIEGDDVTMKCVVDSHPLSSLSVTWMKEVPNPDRPRYDIITNDGVSTLTLRNVTASDRGIYSCIARNGLGNPARTSFRMRMTFATVIDRMNTPLKVARPPTSGDITRATLSCIAAGNPPVTFQWQDENGTIILGGTASSLATTYITDYVTHDDDTYSSNLYVNLDQVTNDVTRYSCVAFNDLGTDATEIKLVPPGVPDPPVRPSVTNVTYDAIAVSWRPGFDGGVTQTFLLQYKIMQGTVIKQTTTDTQRWIQINIPSNYVAYEIDGLVPSTTYWIRLRSVNSYGQSELTRSLVVKTSDQVLLTAGSSGSGLPYNYIAVIAASCGSIAVLLVILLVYFTRRFSTKVSYRPKSINTETDSLPPADASLTGSEGTSPDRNQQNRSFLRSDSGISSTNKLSLGANAANHRMGGSEQSMERDLSRVSYTGDGMSGRSEFSNCDLRMSQQRSSRDTSFTSLAHDDISHREGFYSRSQALTGAVVYNTRPWNCGQYSDDADGQISRPRRANSISSADYSRDARCRNSFVEFVRRDFPISSCEHGQELERSCERREEKNREHSARLRASMRGAETLRYHNDRKPDGSRIYHTLSMNAGRNVVNQSQLEELRRAHLPTPFAPPPSAGAYCHLFQPRGARFCPMKSQQNAPTAGYPSSHSSESSITPRSPHNQSPMGQPPPVPMRDDHQPRFYPTQQDMAAMYAVNVQSATQSYPQPRNFGNSGLYVLGIEGNRSNPGTDEQYTSPTDSENDSRNRVSFRKDCVPQYDDENPATLDHVPPLSVRRGNQAPVYTSVRNSWISSTSSTSDYSNQRQPHHVITSQNVDGNVGEYVRSQSTTPSDDVVNNLHVANNKFSRSSLSSSASSTHPLIPAASSSGSEISQRGEEHDPASSEAKSRLTVRNAPSPPLRFRDESRPQTSSQEDMAMKRMQLLQQINSKNNSSTSVTADDQAYTDKLIVSAQPQSSTQPGPHFLGVDEDGTLFI